MSGIDERPQSVIAKDEDLRDYHSEERIFEREIADRIRRNLYTYYGESEGRRTNRLITEAFREYEGLYEECLMDVLETESLNLDRRQIEAIVSTVEGRLRFVSWSRRNSRWYRLKRWIRRVWNR